MKILDLICEEASIDNNLKQVETFEDVDVSRIELDLEQAKKYNRKMGVYYTITSDAILDVNKEKYDNLINATTTIIKRFLKKYNVKENDLVFVVGLGNRDVTPDSLGPKVLDLLQITSHLKKMNAISSKVSNVVGLAPGVMSQTGIETLDIIKSISDSIKPKLIIVIDALASKSINRLNKTIQITDTQINPGSGIGNYRKAFSKESLNTNILAIGVPTVVDVRNAILDVINSNNINVSNFEPFSIDGDKIQFMVTPKEIDQNIVDMSIIIANSLNNAFHTS